MNDLPIYVRNPDVILREEDPDGGLLFNPDTNQIRILNPTALFLWKRCDGSAALKALVAALKDAYKEVPENEVESHVKEFMDEMLAHGFIGIVDTTP